MEAGDADADDAKLGVHHRQHVVEVGVQDEEEQEPEHTAPLIAVGQQPLAWHREEIRWTLPSSPHETLPL